MNGMLRITLIVLGLLFGARTAGAGVSKVSIKTMYFSTYRFGVAYKEGGESRSAVKQRIKGVSYVFPGAYFAPKQLKNVDFTLVGGERHCGYLCQKLRPVLAFSMQGARIIRPTDAGEIFLQLAEWHALAGDFRTQDPTRVTYRHMVAVTRYALVDIQLQGTERDCRRFMKARGYSNYLFLDGGSTGVRSRIPSHYYASRINISSKQVAMR